MNELTPQHKLFAIEFCKDFNATKAAERAKYSKKTARQQGSRLLTNVNIKAFIRAHFQKVVDGAVITKARVLKEYARIAFLDPRKFFDQHGRLLPIRDLDEDTARALAGFDQTTQYETVDGKKNAIGTTTKIKLADKLGALHDCAKHLGMFGSNPFNDDEVQRFFAGFTVIAPRQN